MTDAKLKILFNLAEELYNEELKKSGYSVLPYCWAKHTSGSFLAFSSFGKCSIEVENKLKEIIY